MVNDRSETGAHKSLMINASQQVIFDPAGPLLHVHLPEKEDVILGISPAVDDFMCTLMPAKPLMGPFKSGQFRLR